MLQMPHVFAKNNIFLDYLPYYKHSNLQIVTNNGNIYKRVLMIIPKIELNSFSIMSSDR